METYIGGIFSMSTKNCKVCGLPLNQSQRSADRKYKSCPKCSTKNGNEHIYYKYPENFGNTEGSLFIDYSSSKSGGVSVPH